MNDTRAVLILVLLASLVVVGGFGLYLLGGDRLFVLALVLVVGGVATGLLAAAAPLVRAYRTPAKPEPRTREIIREVRIVDRSQPLQLPTPAQQPFGVFPELLRASYRAGATAIGDAPVDGEVHELDAGDDWQGDIKP